MNKLKFFIKAIKYICGAGPDPYEAQKVEKKPEEKPEKPKKKRGRPKKQKPEKKDKPVGPVNPEDSLPGEIWENTKYKDYSISNMGRLCGKRGKILSIRRGAYDICDNDTIETILIRNLVAEAFLPKTEVPDGKKFYVACINGNYDDLRAENLRYIYDGMINDDNSDEPLVEVWKTIDHHPKYEISNRGRCRHKPYIFHGRYIANKFLRMNQGYYRFSPPGRNMGFKAGELVAEAFLPKPEINDDEMLYVHYLDGYCTNCYVENLEWRIMPKRMRKPKYKCGDVEPVSQPAEPAEPEELPQPRIIQTRQNGEIVRKYLDIEEIISVHCEWYAEDIEESLKTGDMSYGYYWRYNE